MERICKQGWAGQGKVADWARAHGGTQGGNLKKDNEERGFADGDRVCRPGEGEIHTNVDEYRLLGWGRDLYFLWEVWV